MYSDSVNDNDDGNDEDDDKDKIKYIFPLGVIT